MWVFLFLFKCFNCFFIWLYFNCFFTLNLPHKPDGMDLIILLNQPHWWLGGFHIY
jgi:hypothetical protein